MATAADVPRRYDLVIGSEGFVLADNWTGGDTSNAPQKAIHSFSPAFVPRTNTQGNYGDDQQEFWLTFSQKDWSLGEDQRFAIEEDAGTRRYWLGDGVDVSIPGKVSLRRDLNTITSADTVLEILAAEKSTGDSWFGVSATDLYTYQADDEDAVGDHTLGVSPTCIGWDGANLFVSSSEAGTAGVRKYDFSAWSTFSSVGSDALVFLNNALYGYSLVAGTLIRYSTAGAATTLFTWREADGTALAGRTGYLCPLGGKLLILLDAKKASGAELWIYDGVAPSLLHQFRNGFNPKSICVTNGTVFMSGVVSRGASLSQQFKGIVYYYANGQVGTLWQAKEWGSGGYALASPMEDGLVIVAGEGSIVARYMFYNLATGGVHTIAQDSMGVDRLVSNSEGFLVLDSGTDDLRSYPDTTAITTATLTSSLFDYDSSLTKIFRGIKVEYDEGSDGDGGSVDIAYRVGDVDGAYTTLQTGITSGTEYNLASTTGRAISYKITLNKGTSTNGPVLKRVYVRAVPLGNNYHRARYVLAAWGKDGNSPVVLRDGSDDSRTGHQIAMALMDAAESQTPLSITDKFETFTGIVEQCELIEFRDREYVAQVTVRQI